MKNKSHIYSRYFNYIKPISKLPIIRTYGSTIFTLFAVMIFVFFAIKPTVEAILVLQKQLSDSKQVFEQVKKKEADLSLAKTNYDKLNTDPDQTISDKIAAEIPDSVNLKSLIQNLEQAAKGHEASISALQIQPLVIDTKFDNKAGDLSEIAFTFNVEGAYPNLISLLQDLKTSTRLISVDSLSVAQANDGTALIMSLVGKGYYIK